MSTTPKPTKRQLELFEEILRATEDRLQWRRNRAAGADEPMPAWDVEFGAFVRRPVRCILALADAGLVWADECHMARLCPVVAPEARFLPAPLRVRYRAALRALRDD